MVIVRLVVEANLSKAEPPLGPTLGQYGLNAREVVKNINKNTEKYCDGLAIKLRVKVTKDKKGEIYLDGVCASEMIIHIAGDSEYITMLELANIAKVQSMELGLDVISVYKSLVSTVKSMEGINLKYE